MSRLSIEVTPAQHDAIRAMAFEYGVTIKDFVLDKLTSVKHTHLQEPNSGAGHDGCPICRSYGKNREYNAKTLKAFEDGKNENGLMSFDNAQEAIKFLRS